MAEFNIGEFGDQRLAARGARIFEDVVKSGHLEQRHFSSTDASERAANRFLRNERVDHREILATMGQRTARLGAGRRVVCAQDTTELNFSGRSAKRRGLGPAGDGVSPGYFVHATVAVDADDEAVLGVLGAEIWTRKAGKIDKSKKRPFNARESRRWVDAMLGAAEIGAAAAQLIMVGDRENDIYQVFVQRPSSIELIVRASQDRAVEVPYRDDKGRSRTTKARLFEQPAQWRSLGTMTVIVQPTKPGEKPRQATLELRAGCVRIKKPKSSSDPNHPPYVELTLVESREIDPPPAAQPVLWRLLTTLQAETLEQAREITRLYRLRWRIEQLFRSLKTDGMRLPDTQALTVRPLFNLAAIGLAAAARTMQLVDARDGSPRPATDVIDQADIEAAAIIGATCEGKTARQKNPHPHASLAWMAWIAARLGGWKCRGKRPGPKTMKIGWDKFSNVLAGFKLARQINVSVP